jgi:hypothetical protein
VGAAALDTLDTLLSGDERRGQGAARRGEPCGHLTNDTDRLVEFYREVFEVEVGDQLAEFD